jgi:methylenetetrahydrofolate dehydrogenase (NADP+)/methenyltetrahydrofolate cyclohydrolase
MLTSVNFGKMAKGNLDYLSGTSSSVKRLIDFYQIPVRGKKTLVVGRSVSVGLPIALMMMKYDALISVVHSKIAPEVISEYAKKSDIIILAAGKRGLVNQKDISLGQVVIDCGYQEDGKGDLGFVPDCAYFTPVPGGVGPVTISALVLNALNLLKTA